MSQSHPEPHTPTPEFVQAVAALVPGAEYDPDTPWTLTTPDGLAFGVADDSEPLIAPDSWVMIDPEGFITDLCEGSQDEVGVAAHIAAARADRAAVEVLDRHLTGVDDDLVGSGVRVSVSGDQYCTGDFILIIDPQLRVGVKVGSPLKYSHGYNSCPMPGSDEPWTVWIDADGAGATVVQSVPVADVPDPAPALRIALAAALTYAAPDAAIERLERAGLRVKAAPEGDAIHLTAPAPAGQFLWGGHDGNAVLVGPGYRVRIGHIADQGARDDGRYTLAEDLAGVYVSRWDQREVPVDGLDEAAPQYCVRPQAPVAEEVRRLRAVIAAALDYVERVPASQEGARVMQENARAAEDEDRRRRESADPSARIVNLTERREVMWALVGAPVLTTGDGTRMIARILSCDYVRDELWSPCQPTEVQLIGPVVDASGAPVEGARSVRVDVDLDAPEFAWARRIVEQNLPTV